MNLKTNRFLVIFFDTMQMKKRTSKRTNEWTNHNQFQSIRWNASEHIYKQLPLFQADETCTTATKDNDLGLEGGVERKSGKIVAEQR